jgi:hypothetical protein
MVGDAAGCESRKSIEIFNTRETDLSALACDICSLNLPFG